MRISRPRFACQLCQHLVVPLVEGKAGCAHEALGALRPLVSAAGIQHGVDQRLDDSFEQPGRQQTRAFRRERTPVALVPRGDFVSPEPR